MYLNPTVKARLQDLIGTTDLDDNNPVDVMLLVVVGEYVQHQGNIREYAQRIATSMLRVANGADRHPITLTSNSDLDRYNAAVTGVAALRGSLAAARSAYRATHGITD